MQGYLNLKGYYEFAAENRPSGWNAWVTLAISPAAKPEPDAGAADDPQVTGSSYGVRLLLGIPACLVEDHSDISLRGM